MNKDGSLKRYPTLASGHMVSSEPPPLQDSYRRNEYDHRLIQECSFRISAHIYSEDLTAHP